MIFTQYVTLDEFQEYFNIDLRAMLGTTEKAEAFMQRIADRMEAFLGANFSINIDRAFKYFNDYRKSHYKLALLEQAIYVFKNGDITVDSGYDSDKGVVAHAGTLRDLAIAPNAKNELILCGLWNRHIGW